GIVLGAGILLLTAITVSSIDAESFRSPVLGLLLIEMGAAAFLPWRPRYQMWFGAGGIMSLGFFTIAFPHLGPELVSYWIALIAGAIIGQVACVASNRYRRALDRQLQWVLAGRENLAAEVREREKIIARLRET